MIPTSGEEFSIPYSGSASSDQALIGVTNTGTGHGLLGSTNSDDASGVRGEATGIGSGFGVSGLSSSLFGRGVSGVASSTRGITFGVVGEAQSPDGTGIEELIMYDAARGSFSPDGKLIAYNKTSRENRTWKRYQGGRAQEIYIYDFTTNEEKNITNFKGTDRMPMWIGNEIYYTSDKDRYLNIYSYNTETEETKQLTQHTEFFQ